MSKTQNFCFISLLRLKVMIDKITCCFDQKTIDILLLVNFNFGPTDLSGFTPFVVVVVVRVSLIKSLMS